MVRLNGNAGVHSRWCRRCDTGRAASVVDVALLMRPHIAQMIFAIPPSPDMVSQIMRDFHAEVTGHIGFRAFALPHGPACSGVAHATACQDA